MNIVKTQPEPKQSFELVELCGKDVFGTDRPVSELIVKEGTAWISLNGIDAVVTQGCSLKIEPSGIHLFTRRERLVISPLSRQHRLKIEVV